jgi:hypothetical protein
MEFTLSIKIATYITFRNYQLDSYLSLEKHYLDKIVLSACHCTE